MMQLVDPDIDPDEVFTTSADDTLDEDGIADDEAAGGGGGTLEGIQGALIDCQKMAPLLHSPKCPLF